MPPDRRHLLKSLTLAGAVSALSRPLSEGAAPPFRIIDSNVNLFHWPFRRLPHDEPSALVEKLRSLGVSQAWAGSFEGILHRDLGAVNSRLAAACREHGEGFLIPFGSVNPAQPGWEDDLRQCREQHEMPGLRVHPGYHGYTLADAPFRDLLTLATAEGLAVQVVVSLEDTRTHHPLVRVSDVDLTPLPGVVAAVPGSRVQVLNWKPRSSVPDDLVAAPGICFDMARIEGTDGVARFLRSAGLHRVLFGSHAPFFIAESAFIKVHESDLNEVELAALLGKNAASFLA